MEIIKSSSIVLYFIKEIDGFKEESEADEPRQDQDDCQHSFFNLVCQVKPNKVPEVGKCP
jgi:hypothetical protein